MTKYQTKFQETKTIQNIKKNKANQFQITITQEIKVIPYILYFSIKTRIGNNTTSNEQRNPTGKRSKRL